ncbi:MarR family winged helix-turn-helix transcriptional regulator [Salirhabdus salicampi]|uniref:MarR family winged helix-turn-helix transcriptional regulator n=1 Tax=Salirhabdus salicampi TaxID=476102 RepID=UPI0020C3CF94|nr:MarR family transcriptional regulator [Salirhabdus salicampi]MCP8618099.1 MarR family transcriptional regulator [Salirhabdus salicampi]
MNEREYKRRKEDPSLKLFVVLSKAFRSVSDLSQSDMINYGLNPTEFSVLELLYHRGDQPLQKIGKRILLASGSITYVVDKLEQKGYLYRKPCPTDRRVIFASISDKGKELLAQIFPKHWEGLEQIMAGLDDDEKKQAIELIKKLGQHADKLREEKK